MARRKLGAGLVPDASAPHLPGLIIGGSAWQSSHNPAANTAAAAAKAAPGAGKSLVVTWATFAFAADAVAPAAVSTYVYILGSTAGQVWQSRIALPATAGALAVVRFAGLLILPANDSAAAGFLAAGGANTFESAAYGGYVVA